MNVGTRVRVSYESGAADMCLGLSGTIERISYQTGWLYPHEEREQAFVKFDKAPRKLVNGLWFKLEQLEEIT